MTVAVTFKSDRPSNVLIIGAGGHGRDIAHETGFALADHDPSKGCPVPSEAGQYLAGAHEPLARSAIAQKMDAAGWHAFDDGVWIHPTAVFGPDVELGEHVHIGAGAFLSRCSVGAFTTISPNAVILGDVCIGKRCMIGANATVRNLRRIGDDVTVGAGAVVAHDLLDPATYAGVPARQVR